MSRERNFFTSSVVDGTDRSLTGRVDRERQSSNTVGRRQCSRCRPERREATHTPESTPSRPVSDIAGSERSKRPDLPRNQNGSRHRAGKKWDDCRWLGNPSWRSGSRPGNFRAHTLDSPKIAIGPGGSQGLRVSCNPPGILATGESSSAVDASTPWPALVGVGYPLLYRMLTV